MEAIVYDQDGHEIARLPLTDTGSAWNMPLPPQLPAGTYTVWVPPHPKAEQKGGDA